MDVKSRSVTLLTIWNILELVTREIHVIQICNCCLYFLYINEYANILCPVKYKGNSIQPLLYIYIYIYIYNSQVNT